MKILNKQRPPELWSKNVRNKTVLTVLLHISVGLPLREPFEFQPVAISSQKEAYYHYSLKKLLLSSLICFIMNLIFHCLWFNLRKIYKNLQKLLYGKISVYNLISNFILREGKTILRLLRNSSRNCCSYTWLYFVINKDTMWCDFLYIYFIIPQHCANDNVHVGG